MGEVQRRPKGSGRPSAVIPGTDNTAVDDVSDDGWMTREFRCPVVGLRTGTRRAAPTVGVPEVSADRSRPG